jgi:hypothetical protein
VAVPRRLAARDQCRRMKTVNHSRPARRPNAEAQAGVNGNVVVHKRQELARGAIEEVVRYTVGWLFGLCKQ